MSRKARKREEQFPTEQLLEKGGTGVCVYRLGEPKLKFWGTMGGYYEGEPVVAAWQ